MIGLLGVCPPENKPTLSCVSMLLACAVVPLLPSPPEALEREAFVVCKEKRPTLSAVFRRGAVRVVPPTSFVVIMLSPVPLEVALAETENMDVG